MAIRKKTARRASATRRYVITPRDPSHPLHAAWMQTFEDEKNATLTHSLVEAGANSANWIGRVLLRGIEIVITAWTVDGIPQGEPQSNAKKRNSPPILRRAALREMGRTVPPDARDMTSVEYDRWLGVVGEERIVRYGEVVSPTQPTLKRKSVAAQTFVYEGQTIIVPNGK